MAATIVLAQAYGGEIYTGYAQEVAKNIFYLVSVDDGSVSKASYPIRIPEAGTAYSYEVYIRARCDVAPALKCFNFKVWYDSGAIPAGQTLTVNSTAVTTYEAPTNAPSGKGTRVNFTTKNSEVNSISLTGELSNIGDYSSYLVFQLAVTSAATAAESAVDFIVQYDEI